MENSCLIDLLNSPLFHLVKGWKTTIDILEICNVASINCLKRAQNLLRRDLSLFLLFVFK